MRATVSRTRAEEGPAGSEPRRDRGLVDTRLTTPAQFGTSCRAPSFPLRLHATGATHGLTERARTFIIASELIAAPRETSDSCRKVARALTTDTHRRRNGHARHGGLRATVCLWHRDGARSVRNSVCLSRKYCRSRPPRSYLRSRRVWRRKRGRRSRLSERRL